MKLLDLSKWLCVGYELLREETKTEDLFAKLFPDESNPDGTEIDEIYAALEGLDDEFGEELAKAIEHQTMDTAHPEAVLYLKKILNEHGQLLFLLRIENAFSYLRLLHGSKDPNGDEAKYSLQICTSTEWEAICWSLTTFWDVTRDMFLGNRANTLWYALVRKQGD